MKHSWEIKHLETDEEFDAVVSIYLNNMEDRFERMQLAAMKSLIMSDACICVIGKSGGKVVGFLYGILRGDQCMGGEFAIAAGHRGKGLARLLVKALMERLRELKVSHFAAIFDRKFADKYRQIFPGMAVDEKRPVYRYEYQT